MKKPVFAPRVLASLLMVVAPFMLNTGHAAALTGAGTNGDPYVITTCTDLQDIQNDTAGHYVLGQDIDCTDTINWNSGAGFLPINTFTGTLDGQGHTIFGLYENTSLASGIFGSAVGATIQNLTIDGRGATITGDNGSAVLVANMLNGTISHVHVTEDLISTSGWSGGVVGVLSCNAVGGSATIDHVRYNGSVGTTAGTLGYGGLVGYVNATEPTCTAILSNTSTMGRVGYVTPLGVYVGGLVGHVYTSGSNVVIADSHSSSTVMGASEVGGLVGFSQRDGAGTITIRGSYANGTVTGNIGGFNVGGLVGEMYGQSQLYESYATGMVTAGTNVGGLVGIVATNNIMINDVYATGYVDGSSYVGGLVGMLGDSTGVGSSISNAYSSGTVASRGSYLGGLVGASYGAVSNSFAAGGVLSSDPGTTGGLFGAYDTSNFASSSNNAFDATITGHTECYAATACDGTMSAITTPNYFVGTSSVQPLSAWDFATTWQTTANGLPTLLPGVLGDMSVGVTQGSDHMLVRWTTPIGDQAPTALELAYSRDDATWVSVSVSAGAQSKDVANLNPDTQYYFKIRFTNIFGTSDWLGFVTRTLPAPVAVSVAEAAPQTVTHSASTRAVSQGDDASHDDFAYDRDSEIAADDLADAESPERSPERAHAQHDTVHLSGWQKGFAIFVFSLSVAGVSRFWYFHQRR